MSVAGRAAARPLINSHKMFRCSSVSILSEAGSRLTNTPSWKFGERSATAWMSAGCAPSAAGAPCSARNTHPPVASETVPAASRSAARNIRLRPLEFRWPLLHPCDLRFDDVPTAPSFVEKLFLRRRRLFDGAVVVQHPLGALERQRRQRGKLGRLALPVARARPGAPSEGSRWILQLPSGRPYFDVGNWKNASGATTRRSHCMAS